MPATEQGNNHVTAVAIELRNPYDCPSVSRVILTDYGIMDSEGLALCPLHRSSIYGA